MLGGGTKSRGGASYRTPPLLAEVSQQMKRSSCMLVESLALHDIFFFSCRNSNDLASN
jgi:hypothetical protein